MLRFRSVTALITSILFTLGSMDTRAMALKQSHFSVTGVTIDLSHNSQNQKSIANEKHQSNADLSLAGTTKTL